MTNFSNVYMITLQYAQPINNYGHSIQARKLLGEGSQWWWIGATQELLKDKGA